MLRPEFTVVKTITLANGVHLEIAEKGPRDGTPVVMLHGITDSRRSFEPIWDHLPADWHAVAVSLRGHGASDQRPMSCSTSDFANDIVLLAEALDLAPMVVVGHSMGTSVALQLAADRPDLVRALVCAGTAPSMRCVIRCPMASPIDASLLEAIVHESRKVPARVWRAAFDGLLEDTFCAGITTIQVPVLLVWGSADRYARRSDQDILRSTLPKAQLLIYEHVGHALHWEQPLRFANDLADFVATLGRTGSAKPAHIGT